MFRMSEKPVTSKMSMISADAPRMVIAPCRFMTFWAESSTRSPAEDMYVENEIRDPVEGSAQFCFELGRGHGVEASVELDGEGGALFLFLNGHSCLFLSSGVRSEAAG